MQVDPINPTLKAPGIKLLNAKYGKQLSDIGFDFNLRRYSVAVIDDQFGGDALCLFDDATGDVTVVQPNEDGSYWRKAGAYTRPPFSST